MKKTQYSTEQIMCILRQAETSELSDEEICGQHNISPQTFGTGDNAVTLQDNYRYDYNVPGLPTTAGYDLTTGLGSPKAYSLVHDLATMFP